MAILGWNVDQLVKQEPLFQAFHHMGQAAGHSLMNLVRLCQWQKAQIYCIGHLIDFVTSSIMTALLSFGTTICINNPVMHLRETKMRMMVSDTP